MYKNFSSTGKVSLSKHPIIKEKRVILKKKVATYDPYNEKANWKPVNTSLEVMTKNEVSEIFNRKFRVKDSRVQETRPSSSFMTITRGQYNHLKVNNIQNKIITHIGPGQYNRIYNLLDKNKHSIKFTKATEKPIQRTEHSLTDFYSSAASSKVNCGVPFHKQISRVSHPKAPVSLASVSPITPPR